MGWISRKSNHLFLVIISYTISTINRLFYSDCIVTTIYINKFTGEKFLLEIYTIC